MTEPVFGPEGVEFLRSLHENNNREFFTAHKSTYERAVRHPIEQLTAVAQEKYGPGKVMRPNRDVRFSADKSPYRVEASMWAGSVGGVYLRFAADGIQAGGGLYDPSRDQLARGRSAIAYQPGAAAQLRTILNELHADAYEEAGPALTTAPKGYDRDDPNIELLRLKHYAALRHLPASATQAQVEATWRGVEGLIAWVQQHVGPALSWP